MPAYYFRLLIAAAGIVMLRIWNCLETQHDWRLVLLAGCICFLSCLAAANLFQRARASESRSRAVWLLAAGLMTGCGAWATHFIAMLAYTPGFTISYDLTITIFSLGVAIIVITGGFVVALVVRARWAGLVGGALAGIGVACMHYMGMASLRIPAEIIWMPDLVIASVVLGILFGAVALHVARTSDTPLKAVSAACLLTLAILSHHLVAMSAIGLIRQSAPGDEVDLMSPVALSLAIAAFIAVVVVAGLAGAISDRRIRRKTSERNIQLDAALNNMSQGLCMFGPDNRLQLWNERYVTMYRLPSAKMRVGMTVDDLCEVRDAAGTGFEDMDDYRTELRAAMDNQAAGAGCIGEVRDGRTISVIYQPMPNGGWVVTHEDVTEREGAKRDLERTRSFLDTIIENVPSAIMVKEFPDLRYALINQAGERHLGLDRKNILGRCAADVFPAAMAQSIDARDRQVLASETGSVTHEYKFQSLTGDPRVVITKRIALKDATGHAKYLVSTIHDITERKQSEARIAHLAMHDPLTDLPNRALFNEHLAKTFDDASSSGQASFAILCVDLDRFKEVNDVFGHSVGDLFLCEVARRITAACDGAFVARLGGDEFTIVSSAGPQPVTAERIAARLMAAFDDEFRLNDHAIHASCTIGISVYPQDGADVETLIANADVALYRAKAEERGTIRFFEAAMDQQIREKRILQRDLATRAGERRVRAVLPAAGGDQGRHRRIRGPGALASPRTWIHIAGDLHSPRRGDRPDRRHRRMGAARGLSRGGVMAEPAVDRGQSLPGRFPARRRSGDDPLHSARNRTESAPPRDRNHRGRTDRGILGGRPRSSARSRIWASTSPWTISAPAIRRCPICSHFPSTGSRSIRRSSRDSKPMRNPPPSSRLYSGSAARSNCR